MIEPINLLIVRTDRIGDVILSLPLAELIKRRFPKCKVTYLLREYTECLVKDHPFIDETIVLREVDGKVQIYNNVKELRRHNFDTSIIVYPTFQTALITFLSGIKNRIGTGYRWYSFLFNHTIYEHRKYAEKHELEYNIGLLKPFGIDEKAAPNNIQFHLKVDEPSRVKVETLLTASEVRKDIPIIITHPGSGGSSIDLPLTRFKELVEKISQDLNAIVIITGLESEKELCSQLMFSDRVKNFAGKLSLPEMVALVDRASLFISNSTGPIHIAAALNKPVIGFYPKILSCSSKRWGPYSTKAKIFTPEIDCRDCTREQCERLNCMNSINIDKVYLEVKNFVNFKKIDGEINV